MRGWLNWVGHWGNLCLPRPQPLHGSMEAYCGGRVSAAREHLGFSGASTGAVCPRQPGLELNEHCTGSAKYVERGRVASRLEFCISHPIVTGIWTQPLNQSPSHQHSTIPPPTVLWLLLGGWGALPAPHSPSLHQEGVSPDPQLLFQVEPRKQAGPASCLQGWLSTALSTGSPHPGPGDTGKVSTPQGQGRFSRIRSECLSVVEVT